MKPRVYANPARLIQAVRQDYADGRTRLAGVWTFGTAHVRRYENLRAGRFQYTRSASPNVRVVFYVDEIRIGFERDTFYAETRLVHPDYEDQILKFPLAFPENSQTTDR